MPELPSGTVTFLFTDIAGSTALWERDRQAMAAAVARQLAILQSLIAAHHGVLYKTVGDGTQAAFGTAEDALRAALASQRALLAEDGAEPLGPLRVRMALHAGEAAPDTHGDYLAVPLNRLARLLATGSGGQILLSQTVQQLTRGALPAGSELRDLGEHRLQDLLEPERVYQLLHPDLPAEFPPLKSLENRPNNLPLQPTPFLGREREVQQIVERLRRPEVRFLTLTGPGGTGKTRLALQAAAELLDDFADGVFFIQLAPLTDLELVLPTTATTLGLREEGGQPLGERLRDFLATKQLLLVLDNFEHLAASAPGIGGLLAASPGLKVLATSRMPLRLRAEQEFAVTPLGLPRRKPPPTLEQLSQFEAVRLFIERAQAVKADFTIDNETAPAVAEICHHLDGLPLAIELAAARIRMLPPQAMLARLEHRLPMLTSGARDAPERQRTLRNTIAWSYDLLSPEEQALFRGLAVFVGGCTFEAVEAVTNPDGELDVFGGLERLVEHSLVRQEEGLKGEPRFSMLETIREFGLEKLEASGGTEEARQAHARWCLDFLKQDHFNASDEREWYDRIETEHDNIRAALGWVIQRGEAETALHLVSRLVRFWETRGYYGEGLAWAERARALQGEIPLLLRASGCNAVGELAMWTGNPARAEMMLTEGLALARESGDQGWVWMFLRNLGQAALNSRAYPTAMDRYEEAYAVAQVVAQEEGDQSLLIDTRGLMGELALQMGDHAQATELLTEALALSRAEVDGDYQNRANPLAGLAWIALHQGDPRGAAARYGESLRLFWDQRDAGGVAEILCGVAATAVERHPEPATRVLAAGMGLLKTIGLAMVKTPGSEHELSDQVSAAARQALGEEEFTTAWATGQAMSPEDAVSEALELIMALTEGGVSDPVA